MDNDVILDLNGSYSEIENTNNYIYYGINDDLSEEQLNSNIIEDNFTKVFKVILIIEQIVERQI